MKFSKLFMSAALALTMSAFTAMAGKPEAERWINNEFQPSVFSKAEQMAEMEWFIKASEPFKGMEINVLSETIPTHSYEPRDLQRVGDWRKSARNWQESKTLNTSKERRDRWNQD